jgi:hypothetical protein
MTCLLSKKFAGKIKRFLTVGSCHFHIALRETDIRNDDVRKGQKASLESIMVVS